MRCECRSTFELKSCKAIVLRCSTRQRQCALVCAETKLKEFPVEEKEVLSILTQVNVTRRRCEIVRKVSVFWFTHLLQILRYSVFLFTRHRFTYCLLKFQSPTVILLLLYWCWRRSPNTAPLQVVSRRTVLQCNTLTSSRQIPHLQ